MIKNALLDRWGGGRGGGSGGIINNGTGINNRQVFTRVFTREKTF
jgi:hypothetical protein